MKKYFVEDADVKKGIEREVKYLSQIAHKNIIGLIGMIHTKDSKTMILMEFADCGTVYDYIHKKNEYSNSIALDLMHQLAEVRLTQFKFLHNNIHQVFHML